MTNVAEISDLVPTGKSMAVSEELHRLAQLVEDACPCKTQISFSFAQDLRIAVDVRTFEEVHIVEATLPRLAGGAFHDITRSATPHHAFLKRVCATVNR
jgi:hypothetical protein